MAREKTPWLTPPTRRLLKYFLSFVISFGVGISPVLVGDKVRGFRTILNAYPQDLQDVVPWASLLLSATAVGVHFYSSRFRRSDDLRTAFVVTFAIFVVSVFSSFAAYATYVIRVEVPATHEKVAYLAGSTPLATCECAKRGLDIRECIGTAISLNPDDVSACFSRSEMAMRKTILDGLYMVVMLTLGILIGLAVVMEPLTALKGRRKPKLKK